LLGEVTALLRPQLHFKVGHGREGKAISGGIWERDNKGKGE